MGPSNPRQNSDGQQPLTGIRVLDLSGPMGVYCGKLMADMGADVIKVEPPGGDPMRDLGPFHQDEVHPERSLHWLHFNTNKRSITLDVAAPQGTELLSKIAGGADVVLETFPPGYLDGLGLGYSHLSQSNPGLVYASLTPFGQTGPNKDFKATDLTGFAMGGYMYVTGWPETPPTRLWGSQAYNTTSNRAFIAILLAMYHRMATGEGQFIDVSMQEAVAATTEHVNTAYNYTGEPAVRCGFRHGGQFVATWRCKDGFVSITTNTQQAWDDLRHWMAQDGMAGDLASERFDDRFILRGEHGDHIEELIQAWAMTHTRQEITDWGQANHHPWGPAVRSDEILQNEQLWERGYFIEREDPGLGGKVVYPGAPYKLSESPWQLKDPSPQVGQHNREIYCDDLGLPEDELDALITRGVI